MARPGGAHGGGATQPLAAPSGLPAGDPRLVLLDHALADGSSARLARAPVTRGVPFAWTTAFLPPSADRHGAPVLRKPFALQDLRGLVDGMLAGDGGGLVVAH